MTCHPVHIPGVILQLLLIQQIKSSPADYRILGCVELPDRCNEQRGFHGRLHLPQLGEGRLKQGEILVKMFIVLVPHIRHDLVVAFAHHHGIGGDDHVPHTLIQRLHRFVQHRLLQLQ
ncbi:hypothetical protein D3C76_584580 [compost metagenome]